MATRLGVVAMPTERAVHATPIPYLGGVAMLVGFLVALGMAWMLRRLPRHVRRQLSTPLGVALGAVVLCAVGTLDDVRDVSAPAKTAGMVFGGSVMYLLGVSLLYFRIPFVDGLIVLGPDLAPLITVLWVVGHGQRGEPHRRPRRAGRRDRGHRRRLVLPLRPQAGHRRPAPVLVAPTTRAR